MMPARDTPEKDKSPDIVASLDGASALAKLARLMVLRVRMKLAADRSRRVEGSATPVAIYPNVTSPSFVYQLSGAARSYVEQYILPDPVGVPSAVARLLGLVAGCSPSVGAVALVRADSMLATIPGIVTAITQTPPRAAPFSVAEIHTTRRMYLVFAEAVDRPEWVVQFGEHGELSRLDAALTNLHALVPDLVAGTVAFRQWQGDTWIHIQPGLPGLPWFRLSTSVGGVAEWQALRARASVALSRLQGAIATIAGWNQDLNLGRELNDLLAWYRSSNAPDPKVVARGENAARGLSSLGTVRCQWQHGDYCFNNLLVSPERLGLIDFEEFGQTSMPLHDEFSLAFSTYDFVQHLQGAPALGELLRDCFVSGRQRWNFDSGALEGLLWHHLLWRLRQCDARPKRQEMGAALRRQFTRIVSDIEASRITI
jgi:hypothetical protein